MQWVLEDDALLGWLWPLDRRCGSDTVVAVVDAQADNACCPCPLERPMIHTIIRMGDPRLLRVVPAVQQFDTPALHALAADMFETMDAAHGVGLAAPQIAVDLQLMVFGFQTSTRYPGAPPVPRTALANVQIEPLSAEEEDGWEGCLSIPGLRGLIPRWKHIRYRGIQPDGTPLQRDAEGFHARVVQHEHDHLIGRLYPSRIRDFGRFGFEQELAALL